MNPLRLAPLAMVCLVMPLAAPAADLCVAVIDYRASVPDEELAQAVAKLDVARLGESSTVKSRVKELDGGEVLFFTRVPAASGRQVTRLGVQKSDLKYSVKGRSVTAEVIVTTGTKLPGGQVGTFSNAGSASVSGGQSVLLDTTSRNLENTLRSHGSRRTIRSKSMRLLVAQVIP